MDDCLSPGTERATPKYKVAPSDKEFFACRTVLENNPPSFEFHKKLWGWFFAALKK